MRNHRQQSVGCTPKESLGTRGWTPQSIFGSQADGIPLKHYWKPRGWNPPKASLGAKGMEFPKAPLGAKWTQPQLPVPSPTEGCLGQCLC